MDRFLSSATPDERDALMEAMNELQVEEMQTMFNSLSQRCFTRCVNSFRQRQLDSAERQCIQHCADKYMQHMQRVGQRFAEETMPAAAAAQQQS
jgi:import inner membrane translocase subunit TIM9